MFVISYTPVVWLYPQLFLHPSIQLESSHSRRALGNSSFAFTMETYSNIISDMQEYMMVLLDEILRRPSPASNNRWTSSIQL
jgi:hypothetical protein